MKRQLFFMLILLFPQWSWMADTISISASPASLTINTATAGSQPNNATNTTTTYSITVSNAARSIKGKINTAMPANVTLKVRLAVPTSGTSAGAVAMTTTAQNLITGIAPFTNSSGNIITYTLSATAAAAQVTTAKKTLTLTLQ